VLHAKVDQLLTHQWQRLLEIQQLQIDLMENLAERGIGKAAIRTRHQPPDRDTRSAVPDDALPTGAVGRRVRGLAEAVPFLRLFAPDIDRLHLLAIPEVGRWRFRHLSVESARRMMLRGYDYLRKAERLVSEDPAFAHVAVDAQAVVSDDPVKEIMIAANRTKSRLILAGASERNLSERFFYGNPLEQLLREAPCDVAVYRGPA
jgi:nucleotide-binding universal stress UspA family protein